MWSMKIDRVSMEEKVVYTKRFFDLEDVNKYFGIIGNVYAEETQMIRDEEEYSKPKVLYKIKVKKK